MVKNGKRFFKGLKKGARAVGTVGKRVGTIGSQAFKTLEKAEKGFTRRQKKVKKGITKFRAGVKKGVGRVKRSGRVFRAVKGTGITEELGLLR